MKKSFFIPSIAIAIIVVVFIVGELTQSQPLPLAALPQLTTVSQQHEDNQTIIQKKQAVIYKSIAEYVYASDYAHSDAVRNTKSYSRKNYKKTLASQEKQKQRAQQETSVQTQDTELLDTSVSEATVDTVLEIQHVVQKSKKRSTQKKRQRIVRQSQQKEISVAVNIVNGGAYTVTIPAGSTVEMVMQTASAQGLVYSSILYPGIGSYVNSINGVSEDTRAGMYWIYYVNGTKAQAGISTTTVSEGDNIVWRLERGQ